MNTENKVIIYINDQCKLELDKITDLQNIINNPIVVEYFKTKGIPVSTLKCIDDTIYINNYPIASIISYDAKKNMIIKITSTELRILLENKETLKKLNIKKIEHYSTELHTHFNEILTGKELFELFIEPNQKPDENNNYHFIYMGKDTLMTKNEIISLLELPFTRTTDFTKGIMPENFEKMQKALVMRGSIVELLTQNVTNKEEKNKIRDNFYYTMFIENLKKLKKEGITYVEFSYTNESTVKNICERFKNDEIKKELEGIEFKFLLGVSRNEIKIGTKVKSVKSGKNRDKETFDILIRGFIMKLKDDPIFREEIIKDKKFQEFLDIIEKIKELKNKNQGNIPDKILNHIKNTKSKDYQVKLFNYVFKKMNKAPIATFDDEIIGYDLLGYEYKMSTFEIEYLYQTLLNLYINNKHNKNRNIIRLHAGESKESSGNITKILDVLYRIKKYIPDFFNKFQIRIGHGVHITDDDLLKMKELGIIVEICISSNYALNSVDSIYEIPLKRLRKIGIPYFICTDGGGMYGTDLVQENILEQRILVEDPVTPPTPPSHNDDTMDNIDSNTKEIPDSKYFIVDGKPLTEEEQINHEIFNISYIYYKSFNFDYLTKITPDEFDTRINEIRKLNNEKKYLDAKFLIIDLQNDMNIETKFKDTYKYLYSKIQVMPKKKNDFDPETAKYISILNTYNLNNINLDDPNMVNAYIDNFILNKDDIELSDFAKSIKYYIHKVKTERKDILELLDENFIFENSDVISKFIEIYKARKALPKEDYIEMSNYFLDILIQKKKSGPKKIH